VPIRLLLIFILRSRV